MASPTVKLKRPNGFMMLPTLIKLTAWRLRSMWKLLFVCWLGMLAMVVLVCTVPLFSRVALSAEIRNLGTAHPSERNVDVSVAVNKPTQALIQQLQEEIDHIMRKGELAKYLGETPAIRFHSHDVDIIEPVQDQQTILNLSGVDAAYMNGLYTLAEGRFPQATSDGVIEVAIAKSAELVDLKLPLNTVFQIRFSHLKEAPVWKLRLVGIVNDERFGKDSNGMLFSSRSGPGEQPEGSPLYIGAIAPGDALLTKMSTIPEELSETTKPSTKANSGPDSIAFHYSFNHSKLSIDAIKPLNDQISQLQWQVQSELVNNVPGVQYAYASGFVFGQLQGYTVQITILQVAITVLMFLTLILVLLLVSMQSNLLVERQVAVIAILRSRGATLRNIFTTFLFQTGILGLLALAVGPVLAYLLVQQIAQFLLPMESQRALNVLTDQPLQSLMAVIWYALVAVFVSFIVMLIAVNRASKIGIVTLRRETSRDKKKSFWRRIYLDWIFIILVLAGYGIYIYVQQLVRTLPEQNTGIRVLVNFWGFIAPPLIFAASMMLFLRLFPLILRLLSAIVTRWRSAPAVLAIEQMLRQPRTATRIIVILSLAIAASTFLLTTIATQRQYTIDAVRFKVGADMSGKVVFSEEDQKKDFAELQSRYAERPGVTSATLGVRREFAVKADNKGENGGMLISAIISAIDSTSYGKTAEWCTGCSTQPLSSLMQGLKQHQTDALNQNVVYAIVDEAMAKRFGLSEGSKFRLPVELEQDEDLSKMDFVVQAIITNIPGIYSSPYIQYSVQGMLVDFESYRAVYEKLNSSESNQMEEVGVEGGEAKQVLPNYIWLRTSDDATVRKELREEMPALTDRRELMQKELEGATHLDVVGVLSIGVVAALVLALVGTLLASWISAASRQANFAVLRALGMSPRQVGAVLLWEQGLIYIVALLLGAGFAAMLQTFAAPIISMISLATPGSVVSASVVEIPTIQTVIPFTQFGFVLAAFAVVCIVALLVMARIVSRPSIGQTLRLNED